MRVALREQDFGRILSAAITLILIGTLTFWFGTSWSFVDSFYVAIATLTTSSILDPKLTFTSPWLKLFTSGYVLIGIAILVEFGRRLGMGFITARAEVKAEKEEKRHHHDRADATG